MKHIKQILTASLAVLCGLGSAMTANAADFPNRPVQMVVGFAAGGGADTTSRIVADRLSARWGQPVIIQNVPGANSTIGAAQVANANPDGYTLLWISVPHILAPSQTTVSYDPVANFAPVAKLMSVPAVFVVNTTLPMTTVAEFIDYAKANPGKLSFGSSGIGTLQHLLMELFNRATGTDVVGVPYTGGGPVMVGLLSNEIQTTMGSMTASRPHIVDGKLRALAVTSAERSPILPDVPAISEVPGLEDFKFAEFFGILAPKGTPEDIVKKIYEDAAAVMAEPETQAKLLDVGGLTPSVLTPQEFEAELSKLSEDVKVWNQAAGVAAK